MKFTKSKQEPKKSPEEEYVDQISTLTESELRDLHKDLKIDHYGNSTAAVINTASGVGLFSMRSTTRRYRTECMQIEAMEARMKDMGWTPHPNRYRDAVPIAIGVAAGTTAGMSFGLVSVEKNAKRTKDYVKKKDLFKTKELVETKEDGVETEGAEFIEEGEVAESSTERTQALETPTEHVVVEHNIARKPVPAPAAPNTKVETSQPENFTVVAESTTTTDAKPSQPDSLGTVAESTTITNGTPVVSPAPVTTKTPAPSTDAHPATEPKTTKKKALLSQVAVLNGKMRSFAFKNGKEGEATTVRVTEVACDDQAGPVPDADAVVRHGVVEKLDGPPEYASEAQACVA